MIGPYWTVFISLLISSLLFLGVFIYLFVFPKKRVNPLALLILISLLPLVSILRVGGYESGDLSTHIMESILFYDLLKQGEIIPLWAGIMNASYGYPAFHFTYPLPFYIILFFHFIGFSFINSAKLLLAFSFLFSGIFMYLWLKKEVKEIAAFTGAIFYLFAPYHLIDLHFRADVGEVLAFVFLPLCLLAAKNYIKTKSLKWFLIECMSFAFLLLSHPAIALTGYIVLFLYILVISLQENNRRELLIHQIGCVLSSLLITSFYWIPVMYDLRFTSSHHLLSKISFVKFSEMIYSPWRLGFLFQGPTGQLSYVIGYTHLVLIIYSIILLIRNKISKTNKTLLVLSLIIILMCVFLMLEMTNSIWLNIPFLKNFQFSYRLLGVIIFSASIVAAITVNHVRNRWIIFLIIFVTIFSTILNWGNRRNIPSITDEYLRKQIPHTATNGSGLAQAATIWSDPEKPWAEKIPDKHIEILNGKATIKEIKRNNTEHQYLINAQTPIRIKENTLYFPGWNAEANSKPIKIKILKDTEPKGLISFYLPKGIRKVDVTFKDTSVVKFSKIISIFSIILLICLTIYQLIKSRQLRK